MVLKRLADALRDNDAIYAVILGSAINNDGAEKSGYTAPSMRGQLRAISEAQAVADVTSRYHWLCRDARHRDPAGRPDRVRSADAGIPAADEPVLSIARSVR